MALYHSSKGPVDYTVVGSPTIVDGVASGFSSSDYLKCDSIDLNNNFELNVAFNKTESSGGGLLTGYTTGGLNNVAGKVRFYAKLSDNTDYILGTTGSISQNTNYVANVKRTGNSITLMLYENGVNKETITDDLTGKTFSSIGTAFYIGYSNSYGYLRGSIDLKETYIKVNGQPWFGVCPVEVKHINYGTAVGYTKEGSPTISNGVVSNFSTSNYIKVLSVLPTSGNNSLVFECVAKTQSSNTSQYICAFGRNSSGYLGFGFMFRSSGKFALCTASSSTNTVTEGSAYQVDTYYKFRFETDLRTYAKLYVNDVLDIDKTLNYTASPYTGNVYYGVFSTEGLPLNGSIDLNQTYIKVNDKLKFFRPCINYQVHNGKLVFADGGLYLSGPVNYTVVGSPTITDGVVSGINGSNKIYTSNAIPTVGDLEIYTHLQNRISPLEVFSLTTDIVAGVSLGNTNISFRLANGQSNLISFPALNTSTTGPCYVRFKRSAGNSLSYKYTLGYSNDGITWEEQSEESDTNLASAPIQFLYGTANGDATAAILDLNETYIKVNGNLWFYGKNYASQNIAPVPSGYTYGNTTTSAIGFVDMRTQAFTGAPVGATLGKDE